MSFNLQSIKMQKVFKSILIVIAIVFSGTIHSQTKSAKLENSLLWEVSGNGLSKSSYLYGTIHMICSSDYFLSEKVKKAFSASEKLVLEIDLSDPKEMTEMQQLAMGKEPLSKRLTPEQLTKLDTILKKTTGMTIQQVDSFSLMTIMSLISMKSFGCADLKFYEMDFIDSARKHNLQIAGLETVQSQFKILEDAYSDAEIIALLEELDDEETKQLVAEYKKENLETLYKYSTEENVMSNKIKKIMLDDRNLNWMTLLPEMMKKESVFVAVGSAHLVGDLGVINLLRKAGYTVKAVMN